MPRPELVFPIAEAPPHGIPTEVAPGVYWLRMPLPFSLDHINLWIIEDEDGWNLIDTGIGTETCVELWRKIMLENKDAKPVKRIFVTHMHPDHVGLAGWLCRKWQVPLFMSRTDYLMCRVLVADSYREAPEAGIQFYASAGLTAEQLEYYEAKFGGYGKMIKPLPEQYERLQDGDEFVMAGHTWQVIVGTGHAPEQMTFLCEALNLYISGDQLLPGISSNVSVWPTEPNSNPLQDWLDSCAKLEQRLPADVLVLPAHERPFQGAPARLQHLQQGHQKGLDKLLAACDEPKRVVDLFSCLFRRAIDNSVLTLAVGETLAHLNLLVHNGQLNRTTDSNGVHWYQQA